MHALARHRNLLRHNLDFTGGLLGILALPLPDNTGNLHGGFLIQRLDDGHHLLGLHHNLGSAVVVPEH